MFLTITSIVVAALFGVALTVAIRLSNINDTLRHKIKDTKFKNQELDAECKLATSAFDILCKVMREEKDITYYVCPSIDNKRCAVLRRCFINGKEYATFIKGFNDEDMEFNLREADELCEILNS